MRTIGIVLLILGIVGMVFFGIQAIQQTDTFSFFGINIGVSQANWTPVIVSTGVFVIGVVLMSVSKRNSAN